MATQRVNPDTLAEAHGFAHTLVATGSKLVFTSGQVSIDADGNLIGEGPDYRAQGRQAAANIYAALAAGGASPSDMVRLMIYVVDPADEHLEQLYAGLGEAAREVGAKATATTLIGVTALSEKGAVVELDATALVD